MSLDAVAAGQASASSFDRVTVKATDGGVAFGLAGRGTEQLRHRGVHLVGHERSDRLCAWTQSGLDVALVYRQVGAWHAKRPADGRRSVARLAPKVRVGPRRVRLKYFGHARRDDPLHVCLFLLERHRTPRDARRHDRRGRDARARPAEKRSANEHHQRPGGSPTLLINETRRAARPPPSLRTPGPHRDAVLTALCGVFGRDPRVCTRAEIALPVAISGFGVVAAHWRIPRVGSNGRCCTSLTGPATRNRSLRFPLR